MNNIQYGMIIIGLSIYVIVFLIYAYKCKKELEREMEDVLRKCEVWK